MKFQVFTAPGARLLHTSFAQMGPRPPLNIFRGEAFQPQRGLFRSKLNSKNHNFSDEFPVIFWYIHIMLLIASLNDL